MLNNNSRYTILNKFGFTKNKKIQENDNYSSISFKYNNFLQSIDKKSLHESSNSKEIINYCLYQYIDDNLSNIDFEKHINICFYEVLFLDNKPYYRYLLYRDNDVNNNLHFPSFNMYENCDILDYICNIIKKIDIIITSKYEGFINDNSETFIFYNCSFKQENINSDNSEFWTVLASDIINCKKFYKYSISYVITNVFIKHFNITQIFIGDTLIETPTTFYKNINDINNIEPYVECYFTKNIPNINKKIVACTCFLKKIKIVLNKNFDVSEKYKLNNTINTFKNLNYDTIHFKLNNSKVWFINKNNLIVNLFIK